MKHLLFCTLRALMLLSIILSTACKDDEKVKIETLTLKPATLSLKVGQTRQIEAVVLPENAADKTLVWKSSDDRIAAVDAKGLVTALKSGQTTITATSGEGKSATCAVNVYTEVESISLDPETVTLKIGESKQIVATVLPEDAVNKTLTWKSSDNTTATVDTQGNVTALKTGDAIIEAAAGEIKATCTVTVAKDAVHPLSLFAEYHVGTTPGTFATSQNASDIGYYNFEDAQTACPAGWHLPQDTELYSATDCWDGTTSGFVQHCIYNGKCNFPNVPEKILVDGQVRTFTADYYSITKGFCYALKFKDEKGEYLSAYRWADATTNASFEVRARWLKGDDKKLTVEDIAKEDFWSKSAENDIVRIFPAVGYKFVNGNSSGVNMVSYNWTAIETTTGSSKSGLLLYFLKGNYAYTGAFTASLLCTVRCVKNND